MQLRHFDVSEFDSKDLPGSGVNMKIKFLKMLDAAREEAGIPFRVNSGYRTAARNAAVGGVSNSAHLSGWAADIAAGTLEQKIRIVRAARGAGFNRFGIYSGFIHLDCDPGKSPNVAWNGTVAGVFRGGDFSSFPFDPFTV
ncbi:MAG: peptidase M15 [Lewinellaceae bacterium]|nr:peptidase M15 [Lewinellaceae bacterium]